jgi:hypothetical protein
MSTADIAGRQDERLQTEEREQRANEPAAAADAQASPSRLTAKATEGAGAAADRRSALLATSDSDRFRERWGDVQTHFVDAPREAVQSADALVAELMQHLAETFAGERENLPWRRRLDRRAPRRPHALPVLLRSAAESLSRPACAHWPARHPHEPSLQACKRPRPVVTGRAHSRRSLTAGLADEAGQSLREPRPKIVPIEIVIQHARPPWRPTARDHLKARNPRP